MKKRKILMLILLVSTVLLSGCGKTFLSRLFKSEHEEYTEILTAFLAAANQNDTKKNLDKSMFLALFYFFSRKTF